MPQTLEVRGRDGRPLGWLAVDSAARGLSFGGLRITPAVTREEVEGLARVMTWKLAGQGFPLGGAKAGLRADPRDPALPELLARFADGAAPLLEKSVILGRDAGASAEALDALYVRLGRRQTALALGDSGPARLRELRGYRAGMTGEGAAVAASAAGLSPSAPRVLIQGAGAVGLGALKAFAARGARVIAISDARACWRDEAGLDPARVAAACAGGLIDGARLGLEPYGPPAALLALEADALVLAALSRTVDAESASRVRAGLVLEPANIALTSEARAVLRARGRRCVPDVIAGAAAAGLTCRQLAARGKLPGEEAWTATLAAVESAARRALERAARTGSDARAAHVAELLERVRSIDPSVSAELP